MTRFVVSSIVKLKNLTPDPVTLLAIPTVLLAPSDLATLKDSDDVRATGGVIMDL